MPTGKRFELVLTAAQRGEEWALSALYRQLQPALLGYLHSQRADEAEDLASETWLTVARGLTGFRGDEDAFRRWVFTSARRRLLDLGRRENHRPRTVPQSSADDLDRATPAAEMEAFASLAAREALEHVRSLPPKEAEVVLLRVVAGLSAEDVAKITGRSAVGVRVIQHRALKRLAGIISKTAVTLQSRMAF